MEDDIGVFLFFNINIYYIYFFFIFQSFLILFFQTYYIRL